MRTPATPFLSRVFPKANLIALGSSGFYLGLYYILIKSFSTLRNAILPLYSNIERKIERLDLFKALLNNSRMDVLRMAYFGLIIVGVSFLVAQLANHKKKKLTIVNFCVGLLFSLVLAYPYVKQIIALNGM